MPFGKNVSFGVRFYNGLFKSSCNQAYHGVICSRVCRVFLCSQFLPKWDSPNGEGELASPLVKESGSWEEVFLE